MNFRILPYGVLGALLMLLGSGCQGGSHTTLTAITINNLLSLDSTNLTATISTSGSVHSAQQTVHGTFHDQSDVARNTGAITSIAFNQTLDEVHVVLPAGLTPTNPITIKNLTLHLVITDPFQPAVQVTGSLPGPLTIGYNSSTGTFTFNQSPSFQNMTFSGAGLLPLTNAIGMGGDPNTVDATLSFETDGLPDGTQLTFQFSGGTGVLNF